MTEPVKVRATATDSLAARRKFFARELTAEYAQELAAILRGVQDGSSDGRGVSYLEFRLDSRRFALPVDVVQSVALPVPICRLPQYVDSSFLGLVALGGEVMPCFSLARMMGLTVGTEGPGRRMVVLQERPSEVWAFVADEVLAVITGTDAMPTDVNAAGDGAETSVDAQDEWRAGHLSVDGEMIVVLRNETIFRAMASAVA